MYIKKIYDKSNLCFSIIWIVEYVVLFSIENSSMTLDIITAVFLCVVSIGYALWILKKQKQ